MGEPDEETRSLVVPDWGAIAMELLTLVREEVEEESEPGRVTDAAWSGVGLGAACKKEGEAVTICIGIGSH